MGTAATIARLHHTARGCRSPHRHGPVAGHVAAGAVELERGDARGAAYHRHASFDTAGNRRPAARRPVASLAAVGGWRARGTGGYRTGCRPQLRPGRRGDDHRVLPAASLGPLRSGADRIAQSRASPSRRKSSFRRTTSICSTPQGACCDYRAKHISSSVAVWRSDFNADRFLAASIPRWSTARQCCG